MHSLKEAVGTKLTTQEQASLFGEKIGVAILLKSLALIKKKRCFQNFAMNSTKKVAFMTILQKENAMLSCLETMFLAFSIIGAIKLTAGIHLQTIASITRVTTIESVQTPKLIGRHTRRLLGRTRDVLQGPSFIMTISQACIQLAKIQPYFHFSVLSLISFSVL